MASEMYQKKNKRSEYTNEGGKVMTMLVMLEADWAFKMSRSSFGFYCEAHVLILHKM